jgi:hypothetical protein
MKKGVGLFFPIAVFLIVLALVVGISLYAWTAYGNSSLFNFQDSADKIVGEGITLEWMSVPEDTLREGEGFIIALKAASYEPMEVDGFICLDDAEPQSYGGIPTNECRALKLPANILDGEPVYEEFIFPEAGSYYYENLFKEGEGVTQEAKFTASLKYRIHANSSTNICIPLSKDTTHCKLREKITSINQGELPLEISKIEKSVFQTAEGVTKLDLRFTIEKVQEGELISYDDLSDQFNLLPQVRFEVASLGLDLKCQGITSDGLIGFPYDKPAEVECSALVAQKQEFINDQIYMTLEYGFKTISKREPVKLIKGGI